MLSGGEDIRSCFSQSNYEFKSQIREGGKSGGLDG
jgi:hypothetical protein